MRGSLHSFVYLSPPSFLPSAFAPLKNHVIPLLTPFPTLISLGLGDKLGDLTLNMGKQPTPSD